MTTTTPWPRHYGDRLLRLAKFLEKLPRRKFNFTSLVAKAETRHGKDCGTVCCAVGWTPAVFPKLISWSRILSEGGTILVGRDLFGMNVDECVALFNGGYTREWAADRTDRLSFNATPKQVARSIRAFVAWKRGQAR